MNDSQDDNNCNYIINLKKFETLLSNIAVCLKCNGSLSINTSNRLGLSVQVNVKCTDCGFTFSSPNSKKLRGRPNNLSKPTYCIRIPLHRIFLMGSNYSIVIIALPIFFYYRGNLGYLAQWRFPRNGKS